MYRLYVILVVRKVQFLNLVECNTMYAVQTLFGVLVLYMYILYM